MQSPLSLESKRAAFFERAREELANGVNPTAFESELSELWPGPDGKFDQKSAFRAFQAENLHWVWTIPEEQDDSPSA